MSDEKTIADWLRELEDDNWGDAAEVFREKLDGARRALSFAACVIKSGESWSDTCEEIIGGAMRETRT